MMSWCKWKMHEIAAGTVPEILYLTKRGEFNELIPDKMPSRAHASKSIASIHSAGFSGVEPFDADVATTA